MNRHSRRRFLLGTGGALAAAVLQACGLGRNGNPSQEAARRSGGGSRALPPTPACGDEADVTATQTEGPYFTPNSPERNSFRADAPSGMPLALSGAVLKTDCTTVARALVDVWHADADGEYDKEGYRMRGHLFTDAEGRFRLETIVPGLYPGRTRHYHVKVQAPGGRILTTQLYFPDEPANNRDRIYRPELQMAVSDSPDGKTAEFIFVLEA